MFHLLQILAIANTLISAPPGPSPISCYVKDERPKSCCDQTLGHVRVSCGNPQYYCYPERVIDGEYFTIRSAANGYSGFVNYSLSVECRYRDPMCSPLEEGGCALYPTVKLVYCLSVADPVGTSTCP